MDCLLRSTPHKDSVVFFFLLFSLTFYSTSSVLIFRYSPYFSISQSSKALPVLRARSDVRWWRHDTSITLDILPYGSPSL